MDNTVGVFLATSEVASRRQAFRQTPDFWMSESQAIALLRLRQAVELRANPWRIKLRVTEAEIRTTVLTMELLRGISCNPNLRLMVKAIIEERFGARVALAGWAGFVEGTKGVPQVRTVESGVP